jgi:hypothetical protein
MSSNTTTTTPQPVVECLPPWKIDPTSIFYEPYFWVFSIVFCIVFNLLVALVIHYCFGGIKYPRRSSRRETPVQDDPDIISWLSQTGMATNFKKWRSRRKRHMNAKEMSAAEAVQETMQFTPAPPKQKPRTNKGGGHTRTTSEAARYTINDDTPEIEEMVFKRNSISDVPLSPALACEDPPSRSYVSQNGLLPPLDNDEEDEQLELSEN